MDNKHTCSDDNHCLEFSSSLNYLWRQSLPDYLGDPRYHSVHGLEEIIDSEWLSLKQSVWPLSNPW